MKEFWIDLETTGLLPKVHGIWQFAGIIKIDGVEVEEINEVLNIFEDDEIVERALKVGDCSLEMIEQGLEPKKFYTILTAIMSGYINKYNRTDKFHFYAYNANFDMDFLRAWFGKNKDRYFGSWFYFPPIDIMGLAAKALEYNRRNMKDFKLATVAKEFRIELKEEELHSAMYDIRLAMEIEKRIGVVIK